MTLPENRRRVSRRDLQETPYLVWNEFVDLISMAEYESLTRRQRVAHLVFWYDSEVQNGGHLQYFENQGTRRLEEAISALKELGGEKQGQVLTNASSQYLGCVRQPIKTVEESVAKAREEEFSCFDEAYHMAEPEVVSLLEQYLARYESEFVEVVE